MSYKLINSICKIVDTPFYIYDYDKIVESFNDLKTCLPEGVDICYSIKANPSYAICQLISNLTERVEASSLGEMMLAIKVGFKGENIILSGPGKSEETLSYAISNGVCINVESIEEIILLSALCKSIDTKASIIMRINPSFGGTRMGITMSGVPSQFGIDFMDIDKAVSFVSRVKNVDLVGLSIYYGSQILDSETLVENTRSIIKCFQSVEKKYGLNLKIWDFGGGFGIPYYNEKRLNMKKLQKQLSVLFGEYEQDIREKKIIFESGRYIVGASGSFITKILYKKRSHDRIYLICDGGFNNALIASFFTREIRGNFPIELISKTNDTVCRIDEYYICGPMCSPKDVLGSKVLLPNAQSGDLLKINMVGAYGLTFSPIYFISNAVPAELIIRGNDYAVIRNRTENFDCFGQQHELPKRFLREVMQNDSK